MKTQVVTLIVRMVGLPLFLTAFSLPAASTTETGPASGPVAGWVCALVAGATTAGIPHLLTTAPAPDKKLLSGLFLVLSGWVNPLLLIYFGFTLAPRFVRLRRGLAVAILACLCASWAFFAMGPMYPLVGHYVWVAGILMLLAPEAVALFGPSSSQDGPSSPNQ